MVRVHGVDIRFAAQEPRPAESQHANVNEKASEEVKDFWEDNKLIQKLNILDKKRKLIEAEGVVNFLQTGNERLNDTSRVVHESQLNILERNEAKKSRNDEQEEAEDTNNRYPETVQTDESATDNKPYLLRKRRGNPFVVEDGDGTIIIDDVDELCFNDEEPANDHKIG
ncbi:6572_t:CDS:2 [Acaulospora morrowiae]|uniref:6572_t:CDS:1 n=1 Tax=Acaulospora morrowiae TaxID=94023 RepID=A0A9N9G1P6_9GLOM|nr:6572_t:CDS:2 [Acaulospora morrowiae]